MANQPKKYQKFVATAATATLVASAIVPVASAASLSDIAGNTHEAAITSLVDAEIIKGYADGTFKPNKTLTRSDVVKLLGKYLETQGFDAPADYKTVKRFSDVNLSNDELAKYSAIVADAGVFAGSNGKLLAGDPITRENMAIVLVRMVNTLKDVSLEEYVDGQDFTNEVKDLNVAKAEARSAINVLDFYDITTATNFLPKNSVTRGQFATFLNNVIKADFAGASATTGTVTAINATTIEVKFGTEIKDIAALNFTIEGLEVKNAVIKQSDKTVAVLTTAAQEAGKSYTVKLNGNVVGKFTGISAVIPTAVKIVEQSLQAPVGTQVTLKAQVTVADGQSKAGIPVTFNIVNSASISTATLNQPIVAEAKTDENGVATYTYTRYAQTSLQIASHDEVQAYATGNPTARSFSKVYWANIQPLALTEVTVGNTIQNGGKKVYKVKAALLHTESVSVAQYAASVASYNAKGIYSAGQYVSIGYEENTNVTPDKAVKTVDVIDASGTNLGYPGQYLTSTTGSNNLNTWVKEVKIKLDANGEAIFTLSGLDGAVTPYVFADQEVNPANAAGSEGRFEVTELFAKAAKVTFAKNHTLVTKIEHIGEQFAASFFNGKLDASGKDLGEQDGNYYANTLFGLVPNKGNVAAVPTNFDSSDLGGRDYKVTVTDKDGKLAPKGTKVGVSLAYGSSQRTNGGSVYYVDNTNKLIKHVTDNAAVTSTAATAATDIIWTETDAYGQISLTLIGYKDAYVTPTVVIDSGDTKDKVDNNDQKVAGEIVYFSDARVTKAELSSTKNSATANGIDVIEFIYNTVDQNGKAYRPLVNNLSNNNPDRNNVPVTFELTTTFNPIKVVVGTAELPNFVNLGSNTVEVGPDSNGNYLNNPTNYRSLTVVANDKGVASIKVTAVRGTDLTVVASTSIASLNQLITKSVSFVSATTVSAPHTGQVTLVTGTELTFTGKDAIRYDQANAVYGTLTGATLTKEEFRQIVAQGNTVVQFTIVSGVPTYKIVSVGGIPVTQTANELALATAKTAATAKVAAQYTTTTWAVLTAAQALAETTDAEKGAKATAINNAIAALLTATPSDVTVTSATAVGTNMLSSLLGSYTYTVAGTAGKELAGETVTLTFVNAAGDLVKDDTVTVNADGSFSYTKAGGLLFGTFTKVTAKVTKAGTTSTSTTKEITVTEAL